MKRNLPLEQLQGCWVFHPPQRLDGIMAYDAEKQMLRELAWWVLPQLNCWFCEKPFVLASEAEAKGFGHRRHTKIHVEFTMHHEDENRENNSIVTNIRISHSDCHKRHHKQKRTQ